MDVHKVCCGDVHEIVWRYVWDIMEVCMRRKGRDLYSKHISRKTYLDCDLKIV